MTQEFLHSDFKPRASNIFCRLYQFAHLVTKKRQKVGTDRDPNAHRHPFSREGEGENHSRGSKQKCCCLE